MVFFNHATRQMTVKIVYYGPGLCGKTTNLNTIYGKTSQKARGEMVSLNTETDRTLFFDLLPMDVGMVGGFKTKLQLYTVPGQVFYNSTRKLVLKGVDGIVFVVDSQTPMLDACKESYQNLEDEPPGAGAGPRDIPHGLPVEQAGSPERGVPWRSWRTPSIPRVSPASSPSPRTEQACSRPCGASPGWPCRTSSSMSWASPTWRQGTCTGTTSAEG